MPTILRIKSYRFHFYSNENNEPAHIHVEFDDCECKFWLDPIRLSKNIGLKQQEIRDIEKLIFENQELLIRNYNEYFN